MTQGELNRPENRPLREFAASVLGPDLRIENRSRSFGRQSIIWQITDPDGGRFWLKRHDLPGLPGKHTAPLLYERELNALENWIPLLGEPTWWRSSELVAKSDELTAMILTNVEGGLLDETGVSPAESSEMFILAGRFARMLHDVDLPSHDRGDSVEYYAAWGECSLAEADDIVGVETIKWVREVYDNGSEFTDVRFVCTHMDYSPRNWLIDRREEGIRFGIIDWERARIEHWLQDAVRMEFDHWYREPHLKDAFFDGYGRQLTELEERQLLLMKLVNSVGSVTWASAYGDSHFEQSSREIIERLRRVL